MHIYAFTLYVQTNRDNKQISSDTLIELTEIVLKNNIFEFDEKTFKQVRGTTVQTNFALKRKNSQYF